MTERKYLQDSNGAVYWPMTAIDAVLGLNFKNSTDETATYQRIGNVVFVSFDNVDNNYTIPSDYHPLSNQSFKIDDNTTLIIKSDGSITTTNNEKVSGRFWYLLNK